MNSKPFRSTNAYVSDSLRVVIAAAVVFLLTVLPLARPHTASAQTPSADVAGQKIKLFYVREATKIVAVLNSIKGSATSGMTNLIIQNLNEDEIVLYGSLDERTNAARIISTLDLPRPGINMEMWGIQISSDKPEEMAKVMAGVRAEINRTQQAVRETFGQLQKLTREKITDKDLDPDFEKVLVEDLGFATALNANRPLSLADILLRMVAAREPGKAQAEIANGLDLWLRQNRPDYFEALSKTRRDSSKEDHIIQPPFERFFVNLGLRHTGTGWNDNAGDARNNAIFSRRGLLNFGLNYSRLIHEPQSFSPYFLQHSAEVLNTNLQSAIDSINFDVEYLFVAPTLVRIGELVRRFKDVQYAQVGKVSVATISGVQAVVTSKSVNAFDVTPPLRLSELLTKAATLSDQAEKFVPAPAVPPAIPAANIVGLIGALGEERSVWRELDSGVSLTVTPNVLRNLTSAELNVVLTTGDPQNGTREQGVPPLSRVSQHDVTTTLYVNALDFFDISAFASQSTLTGGRGYVPVIGPIWKGIFGPIPIAGKLFSWQRNPQTVFSESLVLTTSFITPTAMGIGLLYPLDNLDDPYCFAKMSKAVSCYTDKKNCASTVSCPVPTNP